MPGGLRHTCQQIRAWRDDGVDPGIIAVNISAQQLESPHFTGMVMRLIEEYRLEPGMLEFELTETAILQNPQHSITVLEQLRQLGFHLSLDDFGTGYSSLSYLKRLPVDTVKIDRSFVDGLPYEEDDAQIVRMTVAMAKSIGLIVVAEGVESPEQLGYVKDIGCDLIQGFYISKPLPADNYIPDHYGGVAPDIGRTTSWSVKNARPSTFGILFVGTQAGDLPLAGLGMGTCRALLLQLLQLSVTTDASGSVSVQLPLKFPYDPMVGLHILSQMMIYDPGAPTPTALVMTNGLDMRIGGTR